MIRSILNGNIKNRLVLVCRPSPCLNKSASTQTQESPRCVGDDQFCRSVYPWVACTWETVLVAPEYATFRQLGARPGSHGLHLALCSWDSWKPETFSFPIKKTKPIDRFKGKESQVCLMDSSHVHVTNLTTDENQFENDLSKIGVSYLNGFCCYSEDNYIGFMVVRDVWKKRQRDLTMYRLREILFMESGYRWIHSIQIFW